MPLGLHLLVHSNRIEDRGQQPLSDAAVPAEAVQDELRNRRVSHDIGFLEHPEMARHRGLRQAENHLEIRYEERCCGEAVENAESCRLRNGEEQVGWG